MVFDFRLKVFFTVSQKLSFTKAASELFITQPAVTKHINELEQQLGVRLFNRKGSSITLTPAGQLLLHYAEQIFKLYGNLENDLAQLSDVASGTLRIGASTTLSQYVLPRILASFKSTYPAIQIHFQNGNSEFIEQQVMSEKLDLAIVEGISHHPQIDYQPFVKDELVLVARTNNKFLQKSEISSADLMALPLVMREQGSGTLDVIYDALTHVGLSPKNLHVEIQLDNTESIKQYLLHADCAAFLSIHSITRELQQNQLTIIDIHGIDIYRTFQFIQLHGQNQKVCELFKRFCLTHYNRR